MAKQKKKKKKNTGVDAIADFFGGILGNAVKKTRKRKNKMEKYKPKKN